MKNKELFTLNPDENNLINDGVVEINTAKDDQGLKIIRHELKTFVCEGEYQRGIYRILDTYFNDERFLVEEAFRFPLPLARQWQLPVRWIKPGLYMLEEYTQEYRLYFPF